MKVFMQTDYTQWKGTKKTTTYECIFAESPTSLNPTEKEVWDLIQDRPDCYKMGCVTGYPESLFTDQDWKLLAKHGMNNRFVI